ncbi:MAG: hypothetical protein Q4D38_00020 [Planctomycetia bacterium]|nr:hypothetical protein [Planctomycetia bacterium]
MKFSGILSLLLLTSLAMGEEKWLVINEDNDHYFKQDAQWMTREHLQGYIDAMAETHVTHFFMCPQGQRASYDSQATEPVWEGIVGGEEVSYGGPENVRWVTNCKTLAEKGIDPYTVWIERCREKKISPWMTMRMNDVHFTDNWTYFRNLNFWRENPQLWRVPNCSRKNWNDCAFNYAHQEVRDYHLGIVRELFQRYDFDGFELDWMRFCLHLTPGKAQEEGKYLTEVVRQVRQIAREWEVKRGHPIRISVRVPVNPNVAREMGMDAVAWAKEGLVDVIVASCFFSSGDYDIPVALWKEQLGEMASRIPILVGIDNGVTPGSPASRTTLDHALYNGWAANMHYLKADGLYLFNLVYLPAVFQGVITKGLERETIRNAPRRHPISYHDYMTRPTHGDEGRQLPKKTDREISLKILFGSKPERGNVEVILAFQEKGLEREGWDVTLQGEKPLSCEVIPQAQRYGSAGSALRWTFPLSAVEEGYNTVHLRPTDGKTALLIWAEMASCFVKETKMSK